MKDWNVRVFREGRPVMLGQVSERNEALARCAALHKFGVSDDELVEMFQQARATEYAEIVGAARPLLPTKGKKSKVAPEEVEKLASRFQAVRQVDFFDCPKAADVEMLLRRLVDGIGRVAGQPTAAPAATVPPCLADRTSRPNHLGADSAQNLRQGIEAGFVGFGGGVWAR